MNNLTYNRGDLIVAMQKRAAEEPTTPTNVRVTVGETAGWLVGDLFDLEVQPRGSRKVEIKVTDIAEMREAIVNARATAPANHKRSFTNFINEMDTTIRRSEGHRQQRNESRYTGFITGYYGNTEPAFTIGDYPLSHFGMDDLVGAYNRINDLLVGGYELRSYDRFGRTTVALGSKLYDNNDTYTVKSLGFSAVFNTILTVNDYGQLVSTLKMEIVGDHTVSVASTLLHYFAQTENEMVNFSSTGSTDEAVEMAVNKIYDLLHKSLDIVNTALHHKVREVTEAGFSIELTHENA